MEGDVSCYLQEREIVHGKHCNRSYMQIFSRDIFIEGRLQNMDLSSQNVEF